MGKKEFEAYLLVIYELHKIAISQRDNRQTYSKILKALNALDALRPQLEK